MKRVLRIAAAALIALVAFLATSRRAGDTSRHIASGAAKGERA